MAKRNSNTKLKVGDNVIFGRPNGKQRQGRIFNINQKSIIVLVDGVKWRVSPKLVKLAKKGKATKQSKKSAKPRKVFKVGDKIIFGRPNSKRRGKIIKINPKKYLILDEDKRKWRVPSSLVELDKGQRIKKAKSRRRGRHGRPEDESQDVYRKPVRRRKIWYTAAELEDMD